MSRDYATEWRTHAAETATSTEDEQPTAEVTIDGFTFLGRRIPLNAWIQAGVVPEGITAQIIRISRGELEDIKENELPTDDLIGAVHWQRTAITYAVDKPRIVIGQRALQPGEVRWTEIFRKRPDLPHKLMGWIYAGQPGIPVKTEKGETSHDAVSHFPDPAEGSAGPDAGAHVPHGGGETVTEARDIV